MTNVLALCRDSLQERNSIARSPDPCPATLNREVGCQRSVQNPTQLLCIKICKVCCRFSAGPIKDVESQLGQSGIDSSKDAAVKVCQQGGEICCGVDTHTTTEPQGQIVKPIGGGPYFKRAHRHDRTS